ncbi:hypothetical protein C1Y35_19875 [Pseudomonas sp. GW456-L14]|uniref:hypothetical protein n=1 Tax=unclassified Pseudomonas TaxID=196821 RepID=UPI000C88015C|nr:MULTISPECIES: hypothetical protein [unclassified Pseudomonas]PMY37346.1 hypothetical protein C1Y35_19875 [Pseudomonas sp. GW456-L14]PMY59337.1 hypothetical protein C1Y34_02095 [Pseudomonas sp. GW456-L12]
MSRQNLPLKRIADEAESMRSTGYFVDALGRLFLDLAAEAPCSVEKILNGYTVGGIAEGLRIVGSELMYRAEELQGLLEKQANKESV